MSVESLMQTCADLGIKLALKGDDNDRLQVDAPKGTLTAPLREALAANKSELIAALKSKQNSTISQPETISVDPDETVTQTPASISSSSSEATRSMPKNTQTNLPHQVAGTEIEVVSLLNGNDYDTSVIDAKDPVARQNISVQLLAAIAAEDSAQRDRAKQAFVNHGFFNEATSDLRSADSPAERAAAARKLGIVGKREATTHLVASLEDGAPEVRKASVESLAQIGDPSAIAPLNALLLREKSRQLPAGVIRDAINSIAVNEKRPAASASAVVESPVIESPFTETDVTETAVPRVAEPVEAKT